VRAHLISARVASAKKLPAGEAMEYVAHTGQIYLQREHIMGTCKCGYSTDPEKNCNGTHNVVKAVKQDIITKLEEKGFTEASDYLKSN
jgi:hypothetical protein